MARATHQPTDETRRVVAELSLVGAPHEYIAKRLGLGCDKILRREYADELASARFERNAAVAGKLYEKAMSGDTACMIFWLKTQARWRETGEAPDEAPPTPVKVEVQVVDARRHADP